MSERGRESAQREREEECDEWMQERFVKDVEEEVERYIRMPGWHTG